MKNIVIILLVLVFTMVWTADAYATNYVSEDLQCPVCGNKLKGKVLMSTNSFGGQDRDFLSYATGNNPVLIVPVTCEKCYYSGYSSDFGTLEAGLVSKLKEEILTKKTLKPMENGLYDFAADTSAVRSVPAFIKYDLIAKTYKLRGRETSEVFTQYINASWAVRLENEYYFDLRSVEAQKTFEWLRKNVDMASMDTSENNNAAMELAAGRMLAKKAEALEGEDRLYCSLGALFLLRSHGENKEAEKVLEILKPTLDEARYVALDKKVRESIVLERKFQRLAADALENDMAAGKIKGDIHMAQMSYLAGELNRRCLDFEKAKKFYEKAIELKQLQAPLDRYAKEQLELCR
ncbi:MAG TPA: hypothetical protein DC017_12150 [Candidatus Wallbacteria bacterium]|nr:hypothetical protein [Candidatus Wallbacteria bacterium]